MIVFLHVPGFYAAVEQADRLELRERAVLVGGDPRKRGTVTGASQEARRAGVVEGMRVSDALELCPGAQVVPTRLPRYRKVAAEIRALLRGATDFFEPMGLDGYFLESPEHTEPLTLAAELSVKLRADLIMPVEAGVGPTRFVSYLAARHHAAGEIRQVLASEVPDFLAGLPVTEIWGLGPATARNLGEHGVHRIGDLQKLSLPDLESLVGRDAGLFSTLAHGQDHEPLRPSQSVKSLSLEKTLTEPSLDLRTLRDQLLELAAGLESMLARERQAARTVSLALRWVNGEQVTRTRTLTDAVTGRTEIAEVALQLLARTQAGMRECRRVRLQVTRLCRSEQRSDGRQLQLF